MPSRSLLQQRWPIEHHADGRSRRSLIEWHLHQEAPAVGRGLRSSSHARARRKRQPLRNTTLEGGTRCVHWHGKNLRSSWSRTEHDLSVDAPLWPIAVLPRDLPLAFPEGGLAGLS